MTDIQWSRRRPKWPLLAAVGSLFALTLIAPRAWRGAPAEREAPARRAAAPAAPVAAADGPVLSFYPDMGRTPDLATPAPTLPPLAGGASAPAYAGPMAVADDYVVVDETPLAPPATSSTPGQPVAVNEDAGASETYSPPLSGRSVLVRNAAAPRSAPPLITVESLMAVRDALVAAVEQARQRQAAVLAAATPPPVETAPVVERPLASSVRVRVESPDDRLAMLPPQDPYPAPPITAVAPTEPSEIAPAPLPLPEPDLAKTPLPFTERPNFAAPPAQAVLRHRPEALVAQLERLLNVPPAADWAEQTLIRMDSLLQPAADEYDAASTVRDLAVLTQQGFNDALVTRDAVAQAEWLRVTRALDRRLPLWGLLAQRPYAEQLHGGSTSADDGRLLAALQAVAEFTAQSTEGAAWRDYLRLNDLAGLTSVAGANLADERRAAARDVLLRLEHPDLTPQQQRFLAENAITGMARELEPWARGEVSLDTLAAVLERYESTGSQRDAAALAEIRLRMKWSGDWRLQALAEELNRHYRNANVRMAFTAELMNRLIPPQPADVAAVRSRIAGADVRGRSETQTQIHVRLLPDATVWRIGLEAHGQVNSQTRSLTWPARLRNSSRMEYEARKLVLVNRYGLHVWPAEAQADGDTNLVGVDSSFGAVPILGAIIEGAAREQHRASRAQAVTQVRSKVREQACERMDREADAKLGRLDERLREYVLEPIDRFGLVAEPLDMNTTAERVSMRVRLANGQQLAAHTPRPSAPSDSLASFQLHESVFNNGLRALELDGRRMTAIELHQVLSEKFRRRTQAPPDDLPPAAKVEFAAHDAMAVKCRGDRVELTLNIRELRHGRDSIRGVGVHAFFRPELDGLDMKLVRDGTLQFSGAHLRTGPRMVLHSIFGKLLPKDQEVPVLMAKLGEDERFKGLMITQLVIDDGWVAVSLGPARPDRVVWRTHGVERR